MPAKPQKLLDRVRARLRARHMSPRTEQAYVSWIRRYAKCHDLRHPAELGDAEVIAFLTHLAVGRRVARSTQTQAMSALLFLYEEVLRQPLGGEVRAAIGSTAPSRVPVVLTRREVGELLAHLSGPPHLVAMLLYGAGLRLLECLTLRVKDIDLEKREIRVRRGKGGKDRVTMLPESARAPLLAHLERARTLHDRDLRAGGGRAAMPSALDAKAPGWASELGWQWVFPATRQFRDPVSGERRRHHLHESAMQRAMQQAVRTAGLTKHASCHTRVTRSRRTCWRTGTIFGRVHDLLGHADVSTTMIYTHVLNRGGLGVRSPADRPL